MCCQNQILGDDKKGRSFPSLRPMSRCKRISSVAACALLNWQPLLEEGVGGLAVEDATPLREHGGRTARQVRDEARQLRERYLLWSRFGLLLLALGFLLQLIAVWVARA